jgi:hypothetical protein
MVGGAGDGHVDPATLMILRALAGERGKVQIGGRLYEFSCATTFHLQGGDGGRHYVCEDSLSFLRTILDLLRDARKEDYRRYFSAIPSG